MDGCALVSTLFHFLSNRPFSVVVIDVVVVVVVVVDGNCELRLVGCVFGWQHLSYLLSVMFVVHLE